jgi:hypothetical protein
VGSNLSNMNFVTTKSKMEKLRFTYKSKKINCFLTSFEITNFLKVLFMQLYVKLKNLKYKICKKISDYLIRVIYKSYSEISYRKEHYN